LNLETNKRVGIKTAQRLLQMFRHAQGRAKGEHKDAKASPSGDTGESVAPSGNIPVQVPQVRGDVEFYPSVLTKGPQAERALNLAVAEMYIQGVST
jgi:transposase-like protein